MRVTVTVGLDPSERVDGQPASASKSMRADATADLLAVPRLREFGG